MNDNDSNNEPLRLFWEKFQPAAALAHQSFRHRQDYHDVFLAIDTSSQARSQLLSVHPSHKLVLAAASPFFDQLFSQKVLLSQQSKPVIYLHGISEKNLNFMLDFIYQGEVHLSSCELDSFMLDARRLKINGICESMVSTCHNMHEHTTSTTTIDTIDTSNTVNLNNDKVVNSNFHSSNSKGVVGIVEISPSKYGTKHDQNVNQTKSQNKRNKAENAERECFGDVTVGVSTAVPHVVIPINHQEMVDAIGPSAANSSSTPQLTNSHDSTYFCSLCLRYYKNRNSFRTHMYQLHPNKSKCEDDLPDTCPVCNKAYKNSNSLRTHFYQKHQMSRSELQKQFGNGQTDPTVATPTLNNIVVVSPSVHHPSSGAEMVTSPSTTAQSRQNPSSASAFTMMSAATSHSTNNNDVNCTESSSSGAGNTVSVGPTSSSGSTSNALVSVDFSAAGLFC